MGKQAKRQVRIEVSGETALILSAERLFAEQGIAAVALRHINQAANQKNVSAAHYHFGSREGLVNAVLMHRLPDLDARRAALLDRPSGNKEVAFYIGAFIRPLIQELSPREEGNYFIRFMQQYERWRGDYQLVRALTPASVAIYDYLEQLINYLPDRIRRLRIGYLINMVHAVLATAEERLSTGEVTHDEIPLIAENLIDTSTSALIAPISSRTITMLTKDHDGGVN